MSFPVEKKVDLFIVMLIYQIVNPIKSHKICQKKSADQSALDLLHERGLSLQLRGLWAHLRRGKVETSPLGINIYIRIYIYTYICIYIYIHTPQLLSSRFPRPLTKCSFPKALSQRSSKTGEPHEMAHFDEAI